MFSQHTCGVLNAYAMLTDFFNERPVYGAISGAVMLWVATWKKPLTKPSGNDKPPE
jgi:hypothetical protein